MIDLFTTGTVTTPAKVETAIRNWLTREDVFAEANFDFDEDGNNGEMNPNKFALCVYEDDQEPSEGKWYVAEVTDFTTGKFNLSYDPNYSSQMSVNDAEISMAELLSLDETKVQNEKEDETMTNETATVTAEVEIAEVAAIVAEAPAVVEEDVPFTEDTAEQAVAPAPADTATKAMPEQTGKYGLPSVLKDEHTVCLACGQLTKAPWFTSSHMKSCEVLKDKGFNYYIDNYLSKLDRPMAEVVAEKMAEIEAKKNEPKPEKAPKVKGERKPGRPKKEKVDAATVDAAQAAAKAEIVANVPTVPVVESVVAEAVEATEVAVDEESLIQEIVNIEPSEVVDLDEDKVLSDLFG